jgi:glycerol transport system ATP-binding protein
VTHDQVEALTFAEQVVVMTRGKVVQMGTPEALFDRPAHTFVGHFIGSPGMNFLPVMARGDVLEIVSTQVPVGAGRRLPDGALTLGIRPEYLALSAPDAPGAIRVRVQQVQDIGTYWLVSCDASGAPLKLRLAPDVAPPAVGDTVGLQLLGENTCFYQNEELLP